MPSVDAPKAWIDFQDSRAHQERAHDREDPGGEDQRDVPHAQHAALLLDHQRMEEGRPGQPREQRGVLDRVPGPVATPAELGPRPARAEQDAAAEAQPAEQREAARGKKPGRVEPARDQRAECEGERESWPACIPNTASAGRSSCSGGATAATARFPRPPPDRAAGAGARTRASTTRRSPRGRAAQRSRRGRFRAAAPWSRRAPGWPRPADATPTAGASPPATTTAP